MPFAVPVPENVATLLASTETLRVGAVPLADADFKQLPTTSSELAMPKTSLASFFSINWACIFSPAFIFARPVTLKAPVVESTCAGPPKGAPLLQSWTVPTLPFDTLPDTALAPASTGLRVGVSKVVLTSELRHAAVSVAGVAATTAAALAWEELVWRLAG